jgi:hypothetical protein
MHISPHRISLLPILTLHIASDMAPSEVCTLQTGAQSAPAAVNTEHNPSMRTPADERATDSSDTSNIIESDRLEPDFITPGLPSSPQATGVQQPPSLFAVESTVQLRLHTPSSMDDLGQMHDSLEVSSFLSIPKNLSTRFAYCA